MKEHPLPDYHIARLVYLTMQSKGVNFDEAWEIIKVECYLDKKIDAFNREKIKNKVEKWQTINKNSPLN